MTRLLVSVRDAQEAQDALTGGAAIIDVKEPSRGSLGPADPPVWREVAEVVAGRVPVSAALGELQDFVGPDMQPHLSAVQFAKLGLAGSAATPDWRARWAEIVASFPPTVRPVAVSYADWRQAKAPPPEEVIETGHRLGCAAWLIDTYDKSNGGLLDHAPLDTLAALIREARSRGMMAILAGSLTRKTIPQVLPLAPDYIAVRGAVCRGEREGRLDADLVRELALMVASSVQCRFA